MQEKISTMTLLNQQNLYIPNNKDKLPKNDINISNKEKEMSSKINQIKENNMENDKTQLTALPPSDNSCKLPLNKKNNVKELKIEMFLCKKRKTSFPDEINDKTNKNNNLDNNELRIFHDKKSKCKNIKKEKIISLVAYKKKNLINKFSLSSFHFKKNKNNKFEFKKKNKIKNDPKTKIKTIYDYYKSSTNKVNYTYNKEKLLKKLEEQDIIIDSKDKELSLLKIKQKENEELISLLREQQTISNEEINKCRLDISVMLKELSVLKRENKIKWFNEQEYKLGKIIIIHSPEFNKMKSTEFWKEGKEIHEIKQKLKQNQHEIDILTKNNNNNNNDLLSSFKLDSFLKEKSELNNTLKQLENQKYIYLYKQNLFNQEKICTFSPLKKEGLPFLNQRYQIIELIGKGGYSEVYKAYDTYNHSYVACKLIQLNENWPQEIKNSYIKHTTRENYILQKLNHEKIVKLFDTIDINENSFCNILEYCNGPDLGFYLRNNGMIPENIAKIIAKQILEVLLYLNKLEQKIIHYDLKPENILFDNNKSVKITDFGLAKIIEENLDYVQLTSQGVGTYWYLPPECFEENKNIEINNKVDIWSLGVILYEIIFNKKPFGHECSSQKKLLKDKIIQNAFSVEFPEKPEISEECKDFIKNCLKYKQKERYDVFQAFNSKFIQNDINI